MVKESGFVIYDGVPKAIYICDPEKHTDCWGRNEKHWCGFECRHTFHKEFAKEEESESD